MEVIFILTVFGVNLNLLYKKSSWLDFLSLNNSSLSQKLNIAWFGNSSPPAYLSFFSITYFCLWRTVLWDLIFYVDLFGPYLIMKLSSRAWNYLSSPKITNLYESRKIKFCMHAYINSTRKLKPCNCYSTCYTSAVQQQHRVCLVGWGGWLPTNYQVTPNSCWGWGWVGLWQYVHLNEPLIWDWTVKHTVFT
jgi:hypothetical protein